MSTSPKNDAVSEFDSAAIESLLKRVLERLDPPPTHRRLEGFNAVLLALATTASAWCAYQSTLWGGTQTAKLSEASEHGRESARLNIIATQYRAFDAQLLIPYFEAMHRGDQAMADFYRKRFRPEAAEAIEAWLKLNPFSNPDAPKRPFETPLYRQPEMAQAREHLDAEHADHEEARAAGNNSDNYVLLTVLFASVLFFGGVGGTFESLRLKQASLGIATILFLVTVSNMATMPVSRG